MNFQYDYDLWCSMRKLDSRWDMWDLIPSLGIHRSIGPPWSTRDGQILEFITQVGPSSEAPGLQDRCTTRGILNGKQVNLIVTQVNVLFSWRCSQISLPFWEFKKINMTLVWHRCQAPSSLTSCSGCGCCWLLPAIVRAIAGRHWRLQCLIN